MTTEEIKKNESELLENIENINGEDVTLSTSELDNIMSSAEFTSEEVNSEEENLEKYGVWVKVTPEEVTEETEEEASFGLSDLERTEESELTGEEEYLLDELESELPIDESFNITEGSAAVEKDTAEAQIAELADEETFDIESLDDLENVDLEELAEETGDIEMQNLEDDLDLTLPEASEDFADIEVDSAAAEDFSEDIPELVMDEDSEEQIDVSLSESSPLAEEFDDLGALEADLSTPLEPSSFPGTGQDSDSALILQKIEKELAAIKTEISELKNDLLNRNVTKKTTPEFEVQPPPGETTGFFDEEEDETIALTGDELDNILNTAEITEEIAESTEAPEDIVMEESSFDMQEPERLIDKEDLIELEGTEPDEVDEIEINIPVETGEAPVPEETLEDELEEVPALEDELEEIPELAEESLEEVPILEDLEELEESGPADIVEEVSTEIPWEPDLADIELELPEEELTLEEETVAEAPFPEETLEDELEEVPALEDELEEVPALEDELEEVPALEDELEEIPELAEESLEELSEAPVLEESEAAIEELTAEESLEEVPILDDLEELEESGTADIVEEVPTEIPGEPELADIELELPEEELTLEEETVAEAPVFEEIHEEELEEVPLEIEEAALSEGFTSHAGTSTAPKTQNLPDDLKTDIKSVLSYLDQLLESLPEEKIREFADSEYFGIYKKLFEDLGLET